MIHALPYKTKQFFFLLIKLSIVIGAFYFIYQKLVNNENLNFTVFIDFLTKNDIFSLKNIGFLLILTFFNWFLEILKWQNLMIFIKNISFFDALKQSLASLTSSLFTPNRIGDYVAKAAYYSKSYRKRILLLNLISNMAQMSITVIFGIVGLALFITKYDFEISYFKVGRMGVILIVIFSLSIFGIKQDRIRIKGFSISRIIEFIKNISFKIHSKNILLSTSRYLIFSFQFFFLLYIFGVDVSYFNAMIVITSMYFISSVIPTIFLFDVVVKGSVALFLFDIVGVNNLTVLSITTLMWLLNFVLPSIFGSFYVLNFSPFKSLDAIE